MEFKEFLSTKGDLLVVGIKISKTLSNKEMYDKFLCFLINVIGLTSSREINKHIKNSVKINNFPT